MYIVKFIRNDGNPDEEYYYHKRSDAERHLELFRNDDSGIYSKVQLLAESGKDDTELDVVTFD